MLFDQTDFRLLSIRDLGLKNENSPLQFFGQKNNKNPQIHREKALICTLKEPAASLAPNAPALGCRKLCGGRCGAGAGVSTQVWT